MTSYQRTGICPVIFVFCFQLNFKAELIAFGCDFLDDMPGNKDIPHVAGNFNKEVGNIFAIFDYHLSWV